MFLLTALCLTLLPLGGCSRTLCNHTIPTYTAALQCDASTEETRTPIEVIKYISQTSIVPVRVREVREVTFRCWTGFFGGEDHYYDYGPYEIDQKACTGEFRKPKRQCSWMSTVTSSGYDVEEFRVYSRYNWLTQSYDVPGVFYDWKPQLGGINKKVICLDKLPVFPCGESKKIKCFLVKKRVRGNLHHEVVCPEEGESYVPSLRIPADCSRYITFVSESGEILSIKNTTLFYTGHQSSVSARIRMLERMVIEERDLIQERVCNKLRGLIALNQTITSSDCVEYGFPKMRCQISPSVLRVEYWCNSFPPSPLSYNVSFPDELTSSSNHTYESQIFDSIEGQDTIEISWWSSTIKSATAWVISYAFLKCLGVIGSGAIAAACLGPPIFKFMSNRRAQAASVDAAHARRTLPASSPPLLQS